MSPDLYRLPRYVARIVPLMMSYNLVPIVLQDMPQWIPSMERLFNVFFIVLFVRIVRAVLRAARDTSRDSLVSRQGWAAANFEAMAELMKPVEGRTRSSHQLYRQ